MARMVEVAMAATGILVALVAFGTRFIHLPLDRTTAYISDTTQSGIAALVQHAHALKVPLQLLLASVHMLYSAAVALTILLWWMDISPAQVRAWLHQQSLAVTAGLIKLKSAAVCFMTPGFRCLVDKPISQLQGLYEVLKTPADRVLGVDGWREVMEERVRALGEQLEETRRELEAANRKVTEQDNRVLKVEVAFEEAWISLVQGRWGSTQMLNTISSAVSGEMGRRATLVLSNCSNLSDTVLRVVSTMTHLSQVYLDKTSGFSAEGIKHLYRLTQLELLDLRDTCVSDDALEGISALTSLKWLLLMRTNVTDAGLLHLTGLTSLAFLSIDSCQHVTSAGMVHVGKLTNLEQLWASGSGVDDHGLQHLTSLTRLRILALSGITDAGMEHIGRLTALEGLQLLSCAVSCEGLKCLQRLPRLKGFQSDVDGLEALVTDLVGPCVSTL